MSATAPKPLKYGISSHLLLLRTLIAAGTIGLSGTAVAADAETNAAPAASPGGLEEIVVTATRHEESIGRVPISVTAFSQDMIDQKGIKDFQDVVRFTPGVSIDTSGTNAISIRGISSSGGAGTTGIYIDDTPIQMRALGFNPDDTLPKTFDLDRVEILRGPQGTLFGAGSEGGTVRYIMTQPSVTQESTYAKSEVSFTRGGQPSYEIGVAHGGPIVDDVLGFRASVWYRYDGGWIDRIDPTTQAVVDKDANHANTVAARLAFLIQPMDSLKITPSVMFQNARKHDESDYWPAYSNVAAGQFRDGTPERIPVPDRYYLPSIKIVADVGKTQIISNSSYYNRNELTGYQGTSYDLAYYQSQSWLIGSCGSASTSAVPPCSWYPLIDGRGIHLPPGFAGYSTPNQITNQQQSWTEELRWQSNDDTSPWKWTVGAFWSLSKETSIEELQDKQIVPFWNALFGITPQSWFGGDFYYCNGVGTPQSFPNCDIYYNDNIAHDRQLAGFGETTYSITDQWKVTLGGRYAKMSFDLRHHGDGLENYGPDFENASQSQTSFTPKAGVSFQADPSNLFYFTYSKGFRPGGGNAPLPGYCDGTGGLQQTGYPNGAPLTYNSDTTQSYELGSKNNFADHFRIASSVYYIKWKNIQQNVYVPYNCGLQFTDNLGTAVAKGFDVQADMALGGGFTADLAVGYTSARYSQSTLAPKPLLVQSGDAISGEAAIDGGPGTNPPWTVSVGGQYSFKVTDKDAFVRMDWEYTSRNPWLAGVQDPATVQYSPETYTLSSTHFASARTGITLGTWQVALFCDNLFDSRTTINYQLSQADANSPAYAANPLAPESVQQNAYTWRPRTIGITATLRL
ncbi:MAG TPA: TonB-dependent receptor [Steroidobacteraceae bacterium]|nr:TonB-dependent receptor [Steroidobacteraceae bacterium]